MPRTPRGSTEGYVYHVINRGNNKHEVFHKDQDYIEFTRYMMEIKFHFSISIFAYCLMPNHFHLVLMPHKAYHLSSFMQRLMTKHVRCYHKHYSSSGHIWQERFKSFLIQEDDHLTTVLRYVEGNPVRSGLAISAKDWLWSSHLERIKNKFFKIIDDPPIILPSNWTYFIDTPLTIKELEKLHNSVNRQAPFGDFEWQKQMAKKFGIQQTLRPRGRPKKGDRHLFE